jgi:phage terminase large subunit-like protein
MRERIVVGIDPSGARSGDDFERDEIGIVVAARGTDGHGYILADRSLRASPEQWARAAVRAYHEFQADCIVAEQNYGGAMVQATIRAADANVPIRIVTASRGKAIRAEPISALYEQNKVHHVGRYPCLEDQLCAFTAAGYMAEGSPDHADAGIWALSELLASTPRPQLYFG